MTEEQLLWLAVLEQAIIDLGCANDCEAYERPRLRSFAQLWFTSNNHDLGSFHWICDNLNIDPSWLRRRLFAIVDTPPVSGRPQFWHKKRRIRGETAAAFALGSTISP